MTWMCTHCGEPNKPLWEQCHNCEEPNLVMQLRGMIWWLATDLAVQDDTPNLATAWVDLAERHWRLGLRCEARSLCPTVEGKG